MKSIRFSLRSFILATALLCCVIIAAKNALGLQVRFRYFEKPAGILVELERIRHYQLLDENGKVLKDCPAGSSGGIRLGPGTYVIREK